MKGEQLAASLTTLFPNPIKLNMESVKERFALFAKKSYAAIQFMSWPSEGDEVFKGLSIVKRSLCPLGRTIGVQVMRFLLQNQPSEVLPYLQQQLSYLLQPVKKGENDLYSQLTITCLLQPQEHYKTEFTKLIQVETAQKVYQRQGSPYISGVRLSYVVVAGTKPFYQRGADPHFARERGLGLDLEYYLTKQIVGSLEPLLQFHPQICIAPLISRSLTQILNRAKGLTSLFDMCKRQKI